MYPPWFKCFGEKDFLQNPMGDYEGVCDRYHARVYQMKWINQFRAMQHILNTGQGTVIQNRKSRSEIQLFKSSFKTSFL